MSRYSTKNWTATRGYHQQVTRHRGIDPLTETIVNWINPGLMFLIRAAASSTRVSMATSIVSCHYDYEVYIYCVIHKNAVRRGLDVQLRKCRSCNNFTICLHACVSFKDDSGIWFNIHGFICCIICENICTAWFYGILSELKSLLQFKCVLPGWISRLGPFLFCKLQNVICVYVGLICWIYMCKPILWCVCMMYLRHFSRHCMNRK